MNQILFKDRNEFRKWLEINHDGKDGLWLVFDKTGENKTLTAAQALEEALCFGWIDGQIKSIDEMQYVKYFKERRKGSVWSARNKDIVSKLTEQGKMTQYGIEKVNQAKKDGTWDTPDREPVGEDVITILENALSCFDKAYTNYMKMAPSARKGYAMHYFMAKSEETRQKRLIEIKDRLEKNMKPMEKDKSIPL